VAIADADPTGQPASQSVASGQSASFTVGARGSPPLRYQWQFNNSPLVNQTNFTLTLNQVNLSHAGNYRAIVANDYGSATSAVAVLKVDAVAVKVEHIIAAQGNEVLVLVLAQAK
jgi:hypothetical protein